MRSAPSLPGFDVQRLRGATLEALSADPAAERRELDTLAGSRTAERQLGACTFRTVTNPVLDERGARIGTVMEWTDRTQEVGGREGDAGDAVGRRRGRPRQPHRSRRQDAAFSRP